MKLLHVVFKDAWRRKRRVLHTALGVAIGVAAVVAVLIVASAGENKVYEELDKYGPNLMVTPAVSDLDLQLGDLRLGTLSIGDNYFAEDKLPEIRQIVDGAIRVALDIQDDEDIAAIAPKLYVNTEVQAASAMVVGFDPKQERLIKTWWEIPEGKYVEQDDEAVVGARVSHLLDLQVGDSIALGEHEVNVVGILGETGSNDDYHIFVPLATVQTASGKEGLVSTADIRALCSACPVEDITDGINSTVPGVRAVAVRQIAQTEMNLVAKVNRFMLTLAGITLIVGGFGVVNTMMSSLHERTSDIGIMKAVGASRSQIMRIFLYEAIIVGVIGGILGYVAGVMLSYLIGPLIFEGLTMSYDLQYLLPALGLAIVVAILSSVYPAFRASRIRVAHSLRSL
jgi:putative ABC transport system permease protein